MNIFVINLSGDIERRQFQKQQLSKLRLDYKRFIKPYNDIINMDLKNFTKMLNEKGVKGIIID